MRWLLPVQVPGRHRLPVKLFVHAMPPAGGLSLNATTAGAVRLVQLRPDAGGCFRPPQGSWKSGRKAIGRVSRYAKQTDYSLIRHGNVSNTCQEPTVTSIIDLKKTTAWGKSGFPARLLVSCPHLLPLEDGMTTLRAREPRLHLPNVTMVVCSTLGIYWIGYRRCDTCCPLDIFGPPSHSKLTSNDDIITSGTGTMVL